MGESYISCLGAIHPNLCFLQHDSGGYLDLCSSWASLYISPERNARRIHLITICPRKRNGRNLFHWTPMPSSWPKRRSRTKCELTLPQVAVHRDEETKESEEGAWAASSSSECHLLVTFPILAFQFTCNLSRYSREKLDHTTSFARLGRANTEKVLRIWKYIWVRSAWLFLHYMTDHD